MGRGLCCFQERAVPFSYAHASAGLDAQSAARRFWRRPGLLDGGPGGQSGLGVSQPLSAQIPLAGSRQRTHSPTLCKQKRISLGTGAIFPSQSKMPKYWLYLDTGVFQETERGLYETLCSPLGMAPTLPSSAGPKAYRCIGANPTRPPCPTSPSRRHRGTPKHPWPMAGSVGPSQPHFYRGKGLEKLAEGQRCNGTAQRCLTPAATEPWERGLIALDGRGH